MKTKLSMVITVTLTLVLLVFLFGQGLPYFEYNSGESVSMGRYLAFPTEYPDATDAITSQIEGYNINNILLSGIVLPIAAIVLLVLLWKFKENFAVITASGAWGIWGLIGYSTNAALRLGGSTWLLYISLFIITIALSAIYIVSKINSQRESVVNKPFPKGGISSKAGPV